MNSMPMPVLVVGAGPTGLMAAVELSRMGIPVRIIDKASQPATTSRAIGVQARTLELFAQRGMLQPMLAKGNRGVGVSVYGEGKRLFRLDLANNHSDFEYILYISQAETEAVLQDKLSALGVAIERETELFALSQSEHKAFLTAILKRSGVSLEEFDCSYLIDAEGAHSLARTTLDLQFKGKTRKEDYALGDVYVEGALPSTDTHIFSSDFGFMGLFPMGGNHFRMIATAGQSETGNNAPPSLELLQQIYSQRSHIPGRLHDMLWSSWFRINSRMLDRLRAGRVFFGGDSAHIHSPAGGQGMNTGIQDMVNLAWKLAFVIQGYADPKLLDTYDEDRIPVIRNVLTTTEGLTDVVASDNQLLHSVFTHVTPWLVSTDLVQKHGAEQLSQISVNYRAASFSVSRGSVGKISAGDRVPNLRLSVSAISGASGETGAKTIFDILSPDRFTLLLLNVNNTAEWENVARALLPWKTFIAVYGVSPASGDEEVFTATLGANPSLILVRPDGYSAFTAPADSLDELLTHLNNWFPQSEAIHSGTQYAKA